MLENLLFQRLFGIDLLIARAIWKSIPAGIGLPILDPIPKSIRLVVWQAGHTHLLDMLKLPPK